MKSLYYAPLNLRERAYYNDTKIKSDNERYDYILNQQLLFDERMQRNSYTIFENQKKLTEKLKTESKNLNAEEFQKKLYLENPEIYYLPPSEKVQTLAIEQPKIFALPPSITNKIESQSKITPTPQGSPKTKKSSRKPTGELTPLGQLAEDAKIRVKLRGDPVYEGIRELERSKRGEKSGLPIKRLLMDYASNPNHNLDYDKKGTVNEIIDSMIKSRYNQLVDENKLQAEGFKKYMKKNKYKKCRC
jgi:hypothetical protein